MRIDMPCCSIKTCKYWSDGNCNNAERYAQCDHAHLVLLVVGPQAANYLKLNKGFSATGAEAEVGIFKIGELDGKPVFKAPAAIVPGNEILTVWKNDLNENDVVLSELKDQLEKFGV